MGYTKNVKISVQLLKDLTMDCYKFLEKDGKLYILQKSIVNDSTMEIYHILDIIN